MPARSSLMVAGSFAFKNSMPAAVPGLNFFLPCSRKKLRILIETSPKSISTGQGLRHLWHTVQWSATSLNSSKCFSEMPRRVCSSYKNASINKDVAKILLRGLYSKFARGTCVVHTGLHLPQRKQSEISSAISPMADCSIMIDSCSSKPKLGV